MLLWVKHLIYSSHDRRDHIPRDSLTPQSTCNTWASPVGLITCFEFSIRTDLLLMFYRGVFVIIGIGILTTYTGFIIGQVKCRFMHIHSMADAGGMLWGRPGREVLGMAQLVFFVVVMGSHILAFSIMMNVLTDHSACTIGFSAIGLLISFVLTLPRRLEDLSYLSSVSFVSIVGAVFTCMVGVSSTNVTPRHIPLFSPLPSGHETFLAIANIVFAYAGHVAFFTLFSELKDPKDFPRSLAFLQLSEMILYTVSAVVIYAFVGPGIASPALNSAGPLFRKVAYGIAIPTVRETKISFTLVGTTTDQQFGGKDCDWRCRQCPCRGKIHICSIVSGYQRNAYQVLLCEVLMGLHMCRPLALFLADRGKYTGVQ